MNRRGFLGTILAAGAAPYVAKAGVLMPVRKPIVGTIPLASIAAIRIELLRHVVQPDAFEAFEARMQLTREMIAYGLLTTGEPIVWTPDTKNPADMIICRRWLPYSATAKPREPQP